jgi:hypothetical protein
VQKLAKYLNPNSTIPPTIQQKLPVYIMWAMGNPLAAAAIGVTYVTHKLSGAGTSISRFSSPKNSALPTSGLFNPSSSFNPLSSSTPSAFPNSHLIRCPVPLFPRPVCLVRRAHSIHSALQPPLSRIRQVHLIRCPVPQFPHPVGLVRRGHSIHPVPQVCPAFRVLQARLDHTVLQTPLSRVLGSRVPPILSEVPERPPVFQLPPILPSIESLAFQAPILQGVPGVQFVSHSTLVSVVLLFLILVYRKFSHRRWSNYCIVIRDC